MAKEVSRLIKTMLLFDNTIDVHCCGCKDELSLLFEFLGGEIDDHEKPDAYLINNGNVLLVEHFEYDCHETKKGSSNRTDEARMDREIDKLSKTYPSAVIRERSSIESSYELYIKNAIDRFNCHYAKIETYFENVKQTLAKEQPETIANCSKICFLMEDTSRFMPMVLNDSGEGERIELLRCREFLEFLTTRPCVDWVINAPEPSSIAKNQVSFFSHNYAAAYLANTRPYADMEFLKYKPHIISSYFSVPIKPKENE